MTAQRGSAQPVSSVHQLKVTLEGMKPPLWRRLVVPSDVTLGSLHDVIQAAFGWEDAHLHVFEDLLGGRYASPADLDGPAVDEEEAFLAEVLPGVGDRIDYTYDFGDDWLHRITVEDVRPVRDGEGKHAVCVGGRRAMPGAEDLGGVWGLSELLERYAAGERPRATVVRDGGQEWVEYDTLPDEVLAGLYEEGFDPAAFDPAALTTELAQVALRRAAGKRKKRGKGRGGVAERHAPPGMYRCECGSPHPLPNGAGLFAEDDESAEELSLADLLSAVDLRPPAVRLPDEAELARAVRQVPAFMAAVRLGHWCGTGRELTPKGLLRPKLARQAVEEAELWRVDPKEWGDAKQRVARLAKVRSAGDMEPLEIPWEWALNCGFLEVEGGRAQAGDALPDEDDDAALLKAWQEAMVGAAVEISLDFPALDGMLGGLLPWRELTEDAPPLVFLMLLAAYGLPDGEWLEAADYLTGGMEGLPEGLARQLVRMLLAKQYDDTAGTLELFGAAEREGHESPLDPAMALLFGSPDVSGVGFKTPSLGRFRLTALGRSGVRTLLVAAGVPAPVIGSLDGADACELLTALDSYHRKEDADAEVAGWLAARSVVDAAVQVVDACDGTEPADALLRLQAPRVLAAVLEADHDGRAKRVLHKAASSAVTGCSHTAASMLRRIGEPAEAQAAWGVEWMLVDGALPFARGGEDYLRERLLAATEDGRRPLDQVAERADDLWRSGHPHAGEVLGALADAVKPADKALAKRLRKAAFKAGSAK